MWFYLPPDFELEPWIKYGGMAIAIVMVIVAIIIKEKRD